MYSEQHSTYSKPKDLTMVSGGRLEDVKRMSYCLFIQ